MKSEEKGGAGYGLYFAQKEKNVKENSSDRVTLQ
jgi:hypothetical protein